MRFPVREGVRASCFGPVPHQTLVVIPKVDVDGLDGAAHRRYSTRPLRSLIGMVGRRAIRRVNGAASLVLVKPLVVMVARVLGPGPTRLRLVKLAHHLSSDGVLVEPQEGFRDAPQPAVHPTRRAA